MKNPQKTQGQISMQLAYILERNPTFPEKSVFSPPKFLMTFLVISSDFQIFTPFYWPKIQKTITNSLLFGKKHPKKCIFRWNVENPRKTQGLLKTPEKTQGLREKFSNPRSDRKTQDLGSSVATLKK